MTEMPLLAIAEVLFPGGKLPEEPANAVEALLRTGENIGNLSIHSDKMIFFIWGTDKIDYAVLDRIREELKKKGCQGFTITAEEYRTTGKKYSFGPAS